MVFYIKHFISIVTTIILTRKTRLQMVQTVNEIKYLLNTTLTNGITIRNQFPHMQKLLKIHDCLTLFSSFINIICLSRWLFITCFKKMSFFPGSGLHHIFTKLSLFCKILSPALVIESISSLLQFTFRIVELIIRFKCRTDGNHHEWFFYYTNYFIFNVTNLTIKII